MTKNCVLCSKETDTEKTIQGLCLCPECYDTVTTVMQYKNHNDMVEEEKKLLQKFLNKLSKKLLDK